MADSTLADLTDGGTGQATDIVYAVRDPSGTPLNRKLTLANILAYIVAQVNTWTGAQTFSGPITGASNTIDIRNGTNNQRIDFYKTYTDASNYGRFAFRWNGENLYFTSERAGTGSHGGYRFDAGGTGAFGIVNGGNRAAQVIDTGIFSWSNNGSPMDTHDLAFYRIGAGVVGVRGSSSSVGAAVEFLEQTAPAAPAANCVRIYAEDNGSGKTRLMALFPTGAAQQIAIEP